MLTLPQLPTDKLYKLATLGGLAMFLGGLYLAYSGDFKYEETGNGLYTRNVILNDHLIDVGLSPQPLPDDLTDENPIDRYKAYRDLIRTLPITHSKREELRVANEELLVGRLAIRQRVTLSEGMHNNIWVLLLSGGSLFILGILWWGLEERYRLTIEHNRHLEAHYFKMLELLPKRDT